MKALVIPLWYGPAQLWHWKEGRQLWERDEPLQDQRARPVKEAQRDYLDLYSNDRWEGGRVDIHALHLYNLLSGSLLWLASHLGHLDVTTWTKVMKSGNNGQPG